MRLLAALPPALAVHADPAQSAPTIEDPSNQRADDVHVTTRSVSPEAPRQLRGYRTIALYAVRGDMHRPHCRAAPHMVWLAATQDHRRITTAVVARRGPQWSKYLVPTGRHVSPHSVPCAARQRVHTNTRLRRSSPSADDLQPRVLPERYVSGPHRRTRRRCRSGGNQPTAAFPAQSYVLLGRLHERWRDSAQWLSAGPTVALGRKHLIHSRRSDRLGRVLLHRSLYGPDERSCPQPRPSALSDRGRRGGPRRAERTASPGPTGSGPRS